jgi:transposase
MSNKTFTEKEIKMLSKNPCVKAVSAKAITYTDEFKREFIAENEKGKFPTQIFIESGFDLDIIGVARVKSSGKRWRKAYANEGIAGLRDTRKGNSGRPSDKELSLEEKYARLEAENKLLKAENELIKKLEMAERGLRKKK